MSIDASERARAPATRSAPARTFGLGSALRWLRPAGASKRIAKAPANGVRESGADAHLNPVMAVIEAIPEPVLLIDAAARIAAANGPARRRWGLGGEPSGRVGALAAEAEDRRAGADAGPPLSRILRHYALLDAAQGALRNGLVRTVEYSDTAQVEEHFRCTVSPLNWQGGNAALMVFNDRTAQINSERMRVDFVANASHELRTPLTALSMLIETVSGAAKENDADREKFLGMMHVHAERMRRLIDDLLSLSRIELDEHVPPAGRADLVAIVREAVDWAAPIAAKRGVRFELNALVSQAPVVGDRFQIAQVAQNLIDNARKYSPEGGVVEIEIGVAGEREEALDRAGKRWAGAPGVSMLTPVPAAGRTYAYFRVVDHGRGIKRRYLPKLGERFFRVEREEGEGHGGTGLGLAIVKHIVRRHRGGLAVESLPGKGSSFGVYLERTAGESS